MSEKEIILVAVLAGGAAVVWLLNRNKSSAATSGLGGSGAVQNVVSAGTQAGLDQLGNAFVWVGLGTGSALNDAYNYFDPYTGIQLVNPDSGAADAYVAAQGGYVAPGLP